MKQATDNIETLYDDFRERTDENKSINHLNNLLTSISKLAKEH